MIFKLMLNFNFTHRILSTANYDRTGSPIYMTSKELRLCSLVVVSLVAAYLYLYIHLLHTYFNFILFNSQFLIVARIVCHILISSLFGYLYVNVGPTATTVLANYVYLYGTILLIVYTGKMAVVLSCKCYLMLDTLECVVQMLDLFILVLLQWRPH